MKKNTLTSVLQHLVAVICGLVLPREILTHYGSEMNGLVHSIVQFLSYTVLLEFGIGAVIPSALYQPLAEGDNDRTSAILVSGRKVFQRIAGICVGYIIVLVFLFSRLNDISSAELVVFLGLGTVASYTAGKPEQLLIISDQKGYIVYSAAAVSNIINTALQVLLIRAGNSLAIVKLVGALVSIGQVFFICLYVKKQYDIDWKIQYSEEPIPQKWNGIAQHVAYLILENTDIVLLTLFTTLREVSVYSIYFMVISGVRKIFSSIAYSVQPKLGELRAREGDLNVFFRSFEHWIHIGSVLAFGALGFLLVPFVSVYTNGITDANYTRPLFAILMATAYGVQSIRDCYDKLILASGHFKQTEKNYIIAASMNFGISLILVFVLGLEGVAVGTLVAMVYQLIYMAIYDSRVLLNRTIWVFIKQILVDVVILGGLIFLVMFIPFQFEEFFRWVLGLLGKM